MQRVDQELAFLRVVHREARGHPEIRQGRHAEVEPVTLGPVPAQEVDQATARRPEQVGPEAALLAKRVSRLEARQECLLNEILGCIVADLAAKELQNRLGVQIEQLAARPPVAGRPGVEERELVGHCDERSRPLRGRARYHLDAMADRPLDIEGRRILARAKERLFGEAVDPMTVDRFVIIRKLGSGGMGIVFEAYDPDLARTVALKLVREQAAPELADPRRLLGEAQALARLSHPNAVRVYGAGTHDGEVYVAMELIRGTSLRKWLAAEQPDVATLLATLIAAGRGVAAAHRSGVVHRDLKPENILVDDRGVPKVVDFGLAFRTPSGGALPSGDPVETDRLTNPGLALGTPAYMAPEQLEGGTADAASDQFAFCVLAWETLFGERPFGGATIQELREAMRTPPPVPSDAGRVRHRLCAVLLRGLAREPAERHPSMDALVQQLERAGRRSRRAWVLAGAAILALGTAHVALRDPCHDEAVRASERATSARGRWGSDFDGRLDAWLSAYELTCRPAGSPAATNLVRQCLHERRRELESLASAGGDVERLPPLSWCDDADILARRDPLPANASAADAGEVHTSIAEARAAWAASAPDVAARAERAREAAEAFGHRPWIADARAIDGWAKLEAGQREAAVEALDAALWEAVASGHDRLVVEIVGTLSALQPDDPSTVRLRELSAALAAPALNRRARKAPRSRSEN